METFAAGTFGLTAQEGAALGDDRIGRALDRLFDADRATMATELVVALGERFGVEFSRLHNDTTSVKFTGQYAGAKGRSIRGRKAPWITHGYSKDHRPDLKQLVLVLCTSADGGLPVLFRCESGNTNDASTHVATWDALCRVTGSPDFLYVADSKLCGDLRRALTPFEPVWEILHAEEQADCGGSVPRLDPPMDMLPLASDSPPRARGRVRPCRPPPPRAPGACRVGPTRWRRNRSLARAISSAWFGGFVASTPRAPEGEVVRVTPHDRDGRLLFEGEVG